MARPRAARPATCMTPPQAKVGAAATDTMRGVLPVFVVEVLPRLKLFVLAIGVVVDVFVVTLVAARTELAEIVEFLILLEDIVLGLTLLELTGKLEELAVVEPVANDDDVLIIGDDMLETEGRPVFIPPGIQRDPPQESPIGQQAVTPLKMQVG